MRRGRRVILALGAASSIAHILLSCGARTALERGAEEQPEEGVDGADAALVDTATATDSATDEAAPPEENATPSLPGIDAATDAATARCPNGSAATAYLVSETGNLYRFQPPDVATLVGRIACDPSPGAGPFSMAATTRGALYVLYSTGSMFQVDPTSLTCTRTGFDPQTVSFPSNVGIASSLPEDGGADQLYILGCTHPDGGMVCEPTLGRSDFVGFKLTIIDVLIPDPQIGYPAELKSDVRRRLFALDASGALIAIDPRNGAVIGKDQTGVVAGPDLAMLAWNDLIYIFSQAQGIVSHYDLVTKQTTTLGAVGDAIVGAAAAPCVP